MADEIGMVERVARAIYEAFGRESEYVGKYEFFDGATTLDGQFDLKEVARAAISAMRTPTEAMKCAGARKMTADVPSKPQYRYGVPSIYEAMIDAALED